MAADRASVGGCIPLMRSGRLLRDREWCHCCLWGGFSMSWWRRWRACRKAARLGRVVCRLVVGL